MKKLVPIVVIIVAAAAVIAVAVGKNDDNKKTTPTPAPTSNSSSSANETNPPSSNTQTSSTDKVAIEDFAFSPASITVKKGTTVTWTNNDSSAHTVTSDSGSQLKSQNLEKGQTYSATFNETGTFAYHCAIHTTMTGKVVVTE